MIEIYHLLFIKLSMKSRLNLKNVRFVEKNMIYMDLQNYNYQTFQEI